MLVFDGSRADEESDATLVIPRRGALGNTSDLGVGCCYETKAVLQHN